MLWVVSRLSQKHKILNYYRYVDDILLIYDLDHTDIQNILTDFSELKSVKIFCMSVWSESYIRRISSTYL